MPKNALILFSVFGLILAVALGSNLFTAVNKPVPDFSYVDSDGKSGTLYQFQDKPVILHFWASWCLPCRDELPQLIEKASNSPDRVFMLISVDQRKEAMMAFLEPQKIPLSDNIVVIHDPKTVITDHFKVDGFPETIILNKNKTIARHIYGAADWEKIDE